MDYSDEHEIYHANKYWNTNNLVLFLSKIQLSIKFILLKI